MIDNQGVTIDEGQTILDAARKLGIDIPTLCHVPGLAPNTSCMACVVRVNGAAGLQPACATIAVDDALGTSDPHIHAIGECA